MSPSFGGLSDRKKNAARDSDEEPSNQRSESGHRTITLTQQDLRAANRLLSVLAGLEEYRDSELTEIVDKAGHRDRQRLVERARQTFANRSKRSRFFNGAMFGEPAWDMLLALYLSDQRGARYTVNGLLDLSGAPSTTALRWLGFLEREQLVRRLANPTDRRMFYIELTEKGRDSLDEYFAHNEYRAID